MRAELRTDHAAFFTADTAATYDFYTRVMGWPMVMAWGREDGSPPFFQTGYDAGPFTIEFEEQVGVPAPPPSTVMGFPHFGLAATDAAQLEAWIEHLDECSVPNRRLGDDVFFTDPNGLTFQVFVPKDHGTPEERLAKSRQNLDAWLAR